MSKHIFQNVKVILQTSAEDNNCAIVQDLFKAAFCETVQAGSGTHQSCEECELKEVFGGIGPPMNPSALTFTEQLMSY